MSDEERKRKKRQEEERKRREAELRQKLKKRLSLHQKHKDRRKKDNMIGLSFIIAFQGDPAGRFYCNDVKDKGVHTYELIHGDSGTMFGTITKTKPLHRLRTYLSHHVVSMQAKVLIYKAGEE